MKTTFSRCICISSFVLFPLWGQSQVALDASFGVQGLVKIDFDESADRAFRVLARADGRICLAGSTTRDHQTDFALVRLLENGTPDAAFGADGLLALDIGYADDSCTAALLQPDGKMLLGGSATLAGRSYRSLLLLRVLEDGSLDTAFGNAGRITVDTDSADLQAVDIGLLPDGRILVAGNAVWHAGDGWPSAARGFLARFLANGLPDTTFAANGMAAVSFGSPGFTYVRAMKFQASGNILLAGGLRDEPFTKGRFVVARITPDGWPDPDFGAAGLVVSFSLEAEADNLELYPDKRVLAIGAVLNQSFAMARYKSDGTPDSSFYGIGRRTFSFPGEGFAGADVRLLPSGKLLIGGTTAGVFSEKKIALLRVLDSGQSDSAFATNGLWTANIASTVSLRHLVFDPAGNKALLCGDYQFGGPATINMFAARVRLDQMTDTRLPAESVLFPAMRLYPNPLAGSALFLDYPLDAPAFISVQIYDRQGRLAETPLDWAGRLPGNQTEWLNVANLPPGGYLLVLRERLGRQKTALFVKN